MLFLKSLLLENILVEAVLATDWLWLICEKIAWEFLCIWLKIYLIRQCAQNNAAMFFGVNVNVSTVHIPDSLLHIENYYFMIYYYFLDGLSF